MAFTRIRTIKGKQYEYLEERWREGGRVRSRSVSLGPVAGRPKIDLAATLRSPGLSEETVQRYLDQDRDRQARDDQARSIALDSLHQQFGLKVGPESPSPVDAPMPTSAADNADAGQEGAPPDGEAQGQ